MYSAPPIHPAGRAGAASGPPGHDPEGAVGPGIIGSGVTWYDVLGVLPGAEARKIEREYDARAALLAPGLISGAPPGVVTAVMRARDLLDTARTVLGDPESRRRYDEVAGLRRGRDRRAAVPDFRGLFYRVCLEVATRHGLHVRIIRLTERPMAVDGLVVDQDPRPPSKASRGDTLTVQLWHPPARSPW
jgi:curved DNA-binding protein CbpA